MFVYVISAFLDLLRKVLWKLILSLKEKNLFNDIYKKELFWLRNILHLLISKFNIQFLHSSCRQPLLNTIRVDLSDEYKWFMINLISANKDQDRNLRLFASLPLVCYIYASFRVVSLVSKQHRIAVHFYESDNRMYTKRDDDSGRLLTRRYF